MTSRRTSAFVLILLTSVSGAGAAELVAGVTEAPPFTMREADGRWSGIAVVLWERIAVDLGLDFRLEERDLEGLLRGLEDGSLDVAVAALTVTSEREAHLDFTHAYYSSGLGIAVHREAGGGWFNSLRRFVSVDFLKVLGSLSLVLFAAGLLVWLFERRRNPEMFGGPASQGVGSGFWWAAVTMTTVGYGDKAPITMGGRIVALLWMFASLIVISGFTAAIASALTLGGLSSSVRGLDDLRRMRVGTVENSTSAEWLDTHSVRYRGFADAREAARVLADGDLDAVVHDVPILRYLARVLPGDPIRVLPQTLEPQRYAFGLAQESALREQINRSLLAAIDDPGWNRVLQPYLGN